MILKLTSSLKAIQIVDESGAVYGTSVAHLKKLLEGGNSGTFVLLTKMPYQVAANRFPPSPVYQGATVLDMAKYDAAVQAKDAFARAHNEKKEESRVVTDSVVNWDE